MVLRLLLVSCFSLLLYEVMGQAPARINYQAIARNALTGVEVVNQNVFISCKIRANSPSGQIVFQENHNNVQTNAFGLFSIHIGGGNAIVGTMQQIDWNTGNYWLELDLDAGSGLETVGTMQFVSVPYAFHANTVTNADDADADPTNELIQSAEFDSVNSLLTITEAGIEFNIDLSELAGSNSEDELIESVEFDPVTSILQIVDPGNTFEVDLSSLIDDADADPFNELIQDVVLDAATNSLIISDAGGVFEVDLSSIAGGNPNDEVITSFTFDESTSILQIVEAGVEFDVNLSALIEDDDADSENELITALSFIPATSLLQIVEAGATFEVNLSALIDDADADPENELIQSVTFNPLTSSLIITDAGNVFNIDLSALAGGTGTDLIQSVTFDEDSSELTIVDAGSTFIIDLSSLIDDADSDPSNEKISSVDFFQATGALQITEGGDSFEVNLSALINDADPDPTNELILPGSMQLTGNVLSLEEGSISHSVDLSPLVTGIPNANNIAVSAVLNGTVVEFYNQSSSLIFSVDLDDLIEDLAGEEDIPESALLTGSVLRFYNDDGDELFNVNLSALINDADFDPGNELIQSVSFNSGNSTLTISDAGNTYEIDLSALATGGGNPNDELIQSVSFDSSTSVLEIADAGNTWLTNLSALIDDADADPNNETITDLTFNPATRTLQIVEAGVTRSVDLTYPSVVPIDLDPDPTNELIDAGGLSLSAGGVLTISEAGIPHTVDLSPLKDSHWSKNEATQLVFNDANRIAIGTNTAAARLEVRSQATAEPIMRLVNSSGSQIMSVNDATVVVGSNARFQTLGSVSRSTKTFENPSVNYTVTDDDHIIAFHRSSIGISSFQINLPVGGANIGRELIFRFIVTNAFGGFNVTINSWGGAVDFGPANLDVSMAAGTRTVRMVGVTGGWILLN